MLGTLALVQKGFSLLRLQQQNSINLGVSQTIEIQSSQFWRLGHLRFRGQQMSYPLTSCLIFCFAGGSFSLCSHMTGSQGISVGLFYKGHNLACLIHERCVFKT